MIQKISTIISFLLGFSLVWLAFYYLDYSLIGSGFLALSGLCILFPFTQIFDGFSNFMRVLSKSFCFTLFLLVGVIVTMESSSFKVNADEQKLMKRKQQLAFENKKIQQLERLNKAKISLLTTKTSKTADELKQLDTSTNQPANLQVNSLQTDNFESPNELKPLNFRDSLTLLRSSNYFQFGLENYTLKQVNNIQN